MLSMVKKKRHNLLFLFLEISDMVRHVEHMLYFSICCVVACEECEWGMKHSLASCGHWENRGS